MNNAERLKILYNSGKTVFRLKNLCSLWGANPKTAKIIAKRMADKKLLLRLSRGYYALDENFNIYELANLIISPSYVSLHSALLHHGVSFQASKIVASVSLINYQRKLLGLTFKYFSMKKPLFFNLEGIDYKNNLSIARPERAILDFFYFGLMPNIDNIDKINISYLKKLSINYPQSVNKKMDRFIKKLK